MIYLNVSVKHFASMFQKVYFSIFTRSVESWFKMGLLEFIFITYFNRNLSVVLFLTI